MIIEYIIIGLIIVIVMDMIIGYMIIGFLIVRGMRSGAKIKSLVSNNQKKEEYKYSIPLDIDIKPGETKTFRFNFDKKILKDE